GGVFLILRLVCACASPAPAEGGDPGSAGSDEGGASPSSACGDGTVDHDAGETCDPPTSCPTSCDDADPCTEDSMHGEADQCSVVCMHLPVASCGIGKCGNGVYDDDETCDGDCPSCDDGDACTIDTASGSPETCDVVCAHVAITACRGGDGCCPA